MSGKYVFIQKTNYELLATPLVLQIGRVFNIKSFFAFLFHSSLLQPVLSFDGEALYFGKHAYFVYIVLTFVFLTHTVLFNRSVCL